MTIVVWFLRLAFIFVLTVMVADRFFLGNRVSSLLKQFSKGKKR